MEKGNPEFKLWLETYFIERGVWKLTPQGINELSDPQLRMGLDHKEIYSDREREEKTPYFYTDPKQARRSAIEHAQESITAGRASDLLKTGQIVPARKGRWTNTQKEARQKITLKLIQTLKKEPRDMCTADFHSNGLSRFLLSFYSDSAFKAVKDVHPGIREWEMQHTPPGFFNDKQNRKEAIGWLISKLKKGPARYHAGGFS